MSHPLQALFWSSLSFSELCRISEFLLTSNQNWSWVTLYLTVLHFHHSLIVLSASFKLPGWFRAHTRCLFSPGHSQSLPPTWHVSAPPAILVPWLLASELGTILTHLPPKSFATFISVPAGSLSPGLTWLPATVEHFSSLMYSFTFICIALVKFVNM